jgi:hypothetical protein
MPEDPRADVAVLDPAAAIARVRSVLVQLEELEPLHGLPHRGPIDAEHLGHVALVRDAAPGRVGTRKDPCAKLLEDPFRTTGRAEGLEGGRRRGQGDSSTVSRRNAPDLPDPG